MAAQRQDHGPSRPTKSPGVPPLRAESRAVAAASSKSSEQALLTKSVCTNSCATGSVQVPLTELGINSEPTKSGEQQQHQVPQRVPHQVRACKQSNSSTSFLT